MKPAILIAGHGSRDVEGTSEFHNLVELFARRDTSRIVECGFLEFAKPVIQEGIDRCVARGADVVTVLPGMLMAAGHAKNDIPSEVHEARQRYPQVAFHYGRHLHLHANIIQLCTMKIAEAEARAGFDRWTGRTPCCSWWGAAAAIPMPTPMCKSSLVCCGRAWDSVGARRAILALPPRCCPML